jgi:hypothetical protein
MNFKTKIISLIKLHKPKKEHNECICTHNGAHIVNMFTQIYKIHHDLNNFGGNTTFLHILHFYNSSQGLH